MLLPRLNEGRVISLDIFILSFWNFLVAVEEFSHGIRIPKQHRQPHDCIGGSLLGGVEFVWFESKIFGLEHRCTLTIFIRTEVYSCVVHLLQSILPQNALMHIIKFHISSRASVHANYIHSNKNLLLHCSCSNQFCSKTPRCTLNLWWEGY